MNKKKQKEYFNLVLKPIDVTNHPFWQKYIENQKLFSIEECLKLLQQSVWGEIPKIE